MPLYSYKAYEQDGSRVADTIEAATEREASRRLAARGLTVAALEQVERRQRARKAAYDPGASSSPSIFRRRLKQDEVVVVTRELAIMVDAGVPVTEALAALYDTTHHPVLRHALEQVNHEIANGANLSDAFRIAPRLFPPHFCDVVQAAEEGGRLPNALETGATQMEQALELRRKVVGALLYPTLLLTIATLTAGLLVAVVLPRFAKIFENMGTEVPPTTKALLTASTFLQGYWYYVIGGAVLMVALLKHLLKNRRFATCWTHAMMRAPIAGDIIRKLAVSRALAVLGSLLASNVPLLQALAHAARVSGNLVIEDALRWVGDRVEAGRSLADGLRESGALPHVVVQMAEVGERTGSLPAVMGKTAAFYESEVDTRLRSLTSIIEPVMIVGLGIFVGFITLSVITPIYSLVGSVR
jgi:type II secretory pathway component PulF